MWRCKWVHFAFNLGYLSTFDLVVDWNDIRRTIFDTDYIADIINKML